MQPSSARGARFFSSAFYLFYFAAMAALMPYLALYYQHIGLSARQIGLLGGVSPLVTLFAAPLWGAVADATQRHKALLLAAIAASLGVVALLSVTTGWLWLIPIVLAYAFFGAPVSPLVDNSVVALLGERRDEYGQMRLWGAVGWGISAPIAGMLIEQNGLRWAFYGYFALMSVTLLVVACLPIARSSIGQRLGRDLRLLLAHRQWLLFLTTIFVGSLGLSFVLNFLFLYLDRLGASKTLMGFSLTFATLSEIPMWFLAGRFLRRWGSRGLLMLSLLACGAQTFAFSLIRAPWLALPIQLLHGPAFAAMWTAGVSYAADIAPEGAKATAQGMFGGVAMGLRAAVGSLVGGLLFDGVGPAAMFRVGTACALAGLLLFIWAGRADRAQRRSR